jgi:hypothetical protein
MSRTQITIKSEPVGFGTPSRRAPTVEDLAGDGREPKRIKLEKDVSSATHIEDPDLTALEDEIKREEEELAAAQRVAEILQRTNEKKARLASLQQAKRNGTPLSK